MNMWRYHLYIYNAYHITIDILMVYDNGDINH
jgi:hypothetical protein